MLTTVAILAMNIQVAEAVRADDPQTWVLEYPRAISPQISEYYSCLQSREVRISGATTFEAQHRIAVTKCLDVRQEKLDSANAVLAKSPRDDEPTPTEIAVVFDRLGMIHVARGKDLDDQMAVRVSARAYQRSPIEATAARAAESDGATDIEAPAEVPTEGNATTQ